MNESSFLGTGWSFPPVFDNANYQLQLSSGESNINQSIDLLMKTPRGSRSLMPNYGCDLCRYLFCRLDATLQEEIIQSVKTTLLNSEPRISVEDVDISLSEDGSIATLSISYKIKQTNTRHNHVFPFSLLEGTHLPVSQL
ncbi:MAG: GPW/gp25 family protein [Gammaproteobacteria bacterium]|nr:GPW/gp25 family protein [Gammaproteobacteria bacterium]